MRESIESRLGPDLRSLVENLPGALVAAEEVTSRRSATSPRGAFQLTFSDGSVLKGRRFASPRAARTAKLILDAAPRSHFPAAIAHRGDALLEEWIDGDSVDPRGITASEMRDLGRTLGLLHRQPCPWASQGAVRDVADWMGRTKLNAEVLVANGAVKRTTSQTIMHTLDTLAPSHAEIGCAHRDPRPANLIRDRCRAQPACDLLWVDSGSLAVGAVDEDLARVWMHWPMNDSQRKAFLAGYRLERDPGPFFDSFDFWMLVIQVQSARIEIECGASAAHAPSPVGLEWLQMRAETRLL